MRLKYTGFSQMVVISDDSSRELGHVKKTLNHEGVSLTIWGFMTAYCREFMCKTEEKNGQV